MATTPMSRVVGHLRRAALLQEADRLTDAQLLDSFLVGQEDAAFEALVRRHGPMILGVCRRVLHDRHDAEDAFQATFLVLLRKAGSIGRRELLVNWLFGVAHRTALQSRKATARRRVKERQVHDMARKQVTGDDAIQDMLPHLDQELSRLPDKYRVPIILCDLEGKTRKKAAQQLGLLEATLSMRLDRARATLAKRLTRHGTTLSGGAVALAVSQRMASASVPPSLVSSTVKIGALVVAGKTGVAGAISAKVAALTDGVVKTMLLTKLKTLAAILFMVGVVGIGAGRFSASASVDNQVDSQRPGGPGKEKLVRAAKPDGAAKETPVALTIDVADPTQSPLVNLVGHTDSVVSLAFSPDGKSIASVSHDQTIKLWDLANWREKVTLKGRTGPAQPMAYSPDGKTLASGSHNRNTIMLWDTATGKEIATLDAGTNGASFELAYSPDAKTLAVGADTIRLLDAKSGNEQAILKGYTGNVRYLAFSPDGKTLASTIDTTIKLWVVAAGGKQAVLNGHASYVDSVAFSPDGKTLASASEDKTISLWDLTRGTVTAILKGHRGAVYSVAFSPDGKTLASASRDQTIRLWDLATENETAILKGHTASVYCVAFSPDGKILASASEDKTIKLWSVQAISMFEKAKQGTFLEKDKKSADQKPTLVNPLDAIYRMADAEFQKLDGNGDGYLNQGEMPPELKAEFRKWDTNRDNLISQQEYRVYYAVKSQPARERAQRDFTWLPAWFREMDANKDGQIDLFEWRKAGKDPSEFEKWDRNDDGYITPEEADFKQRLDQIEKALKRLNGTRNDAESDFEALDSIRLAVGEMQRALHLRR